MNLRDNKVVLITGGAKRLGKAIAIKFAENKYNVAIHYNKSYIDAKKLCNELNSKYEIKSYYFRADLKRYKQIKNLIDKVYKKFHRLDVLINNAAIFQLSDLKNTSEKIWDDILDTNLKAAFFISKYASSKMLKSGEGVIINIASLGGLKPFVKYIPYSVSKAGLIMLTKCLAKSLAPKIRVNAIAPGTIQFDSEKSASEDILLNTYTNPIEIAQMVFSLTEKYKHITGQCIAIEGGNLLI